jgi:hypothetical protein
MTLSIPERWEAQLLDGLYVMSGAFHGRKITTTLDRWRQGSADEPLFCHTSLQVIN